MKGKYKVVVDNKKIHYEFEIKRNITILKGNSATGKTALIELIGEYYENGSSTGTTVTCEKECVVLAGRRWRHDLNHIHDSIVFIDEWNSFLNDNEFADRIQDTDNYYVIATRMGLPNLPYSVEEVYGVRESGGGSVLDKTYNELFHIYGNHHLGDVVHPTKVLTEDSASGFDFFENICRQSGIRCESAFGKSGIKKKIEQNKRHELLVIADGSAFGAEMERIYGNIYYQDNIYLYLPESFEWLLLKSGILEEPEIQKILDHPEEYIDSGEYFSWERYFTHLLTESAKGGRFDYSKKKLSKAYFTDEVIDKVLAIMKNINLG